MHDAPRPDSADVRRNFILNVVDGAVFAFALSFASRSAVLPVYVESIGGNSVALSLIPVIWILGFNLPQLAVANLAGQVSPKKPFVLKTALVQRLAWLLLAAVTFVVAGRLDSGLALPLFFVLYALAAAAGSINLPVWFDLIAKITPVRLRGRLFALRTVVGALLGIMGGWVVERILAADSSPSGFALLFAIAFCVMMVGYLSLVLLREGEATVPKRRLRYREYLRELPQVLRRERNFRNFLIADSLLISAMMVEAFFAVDAIRTFGLPDAYAGRFTVVVMISMAAGTLLFGWVADHWGHRLNLILASAWMAVGATAALLAPSVEVYYLAFVGIACAVGLRTTSQLPIIAEISGEEDRPTFVALTNVLTAPFVLAGVAGGWFANQFGFDAVFAAAAVLAAASCAWYGFVVQEPRRRAVP